MENDRVNLARNFIKAIFKAKKMLKIYPSNNVIYLAAINETYVAAKEYLDQHGDLTLQIKPTAILLGSEQVYENRERVDNFALFFFKEGVREVIFKDSLSRSELEDFLRLTGTDFDKDDSGDDLLSAVWSRGYETVKLTIDEVAYIEADDSFGGGQYSGGGETHGEIHGETHGETSERLDSATGSGGADLHPKGNTSALGSLFSFGLDMPEDITTGETIAGGIYTHGPTEDNALSMAYQDAINKEDTIAIVAGELTADETAIMLTEMQQDSAEKCDHFATILVAMLSQARTVADAERLTKALKDLILFSLRRDDLGPALIALRMTEEIQGNQREIPELNEPIANFFSFCRSADIMDKLGNLLDYSKEFDEGTLQEYAERLGGEAIYAFIALLARLENIHARRMVNNILIRLGKQNVQAFCAHLKDPTWYVVRNMVFILRNIGDSSILDDIMAVAKHDHPRVRLEVVKALHDLKSEMALQALKDFLDDKDSTVRLTAVTVIGAMAKDNTVSSQLARDVIIAKIMEKGFEERDFKERKSFCETLALLHDRIADEYMMSILRKKSIFGGRKKSQKKACAAYYLGLVKCNEALTLLEKLSGSSDLLLREHALAAIQRINND